MTFSKDALIQRANQFSKEKFDEKIKKLVDNIKKENQWT